MCVCVCVYVPYVYVYVHIQSMYASPVKTLTRCLPTATNNTQNRANTKKKKNRFLLVNFLRRVCPSLFSDQLPSNVARGFRAGAKDGGGEQVGGRWGGSKGLQLACRGGAVALSSTLLCFQIFVALSGAHNTKRAPQIEGGEGRTKNEGGGGP